MTYEFIFIYPNCVIHQSLCYIVCFIFILFRLIFVYMRNNFIHDFNHYSLYELVT